MRLIVYKGRTYAAIEAFDFGSIEKLRKDILTLLASVPKAKDYDEALKLKNAFRTWKTYFDETVFQSLKAHGIEAVISEYIGGRGSEFQRGEINKWVKYWQDRIGKECWGLYIELDLPLDRWERRKKDWGSRQTTDEDWKQECFREFVTKSPPWVAKVKREARKAWVVLKEFITWIEAKEKKVLIQKKTREVVSVEGFQCEFVDWEAGYKPEESLEALKVGLNRFKKRAAEIFPWILRNRLPLKVHFRAELDKGGNYSKERIAIWIASRKPLEITHTVAHEYGHHIWDLYLSEEMKEFWKVAISGDYGPLKLQDLLDAWERSKSENWWDFEHDLIDKDPVMYLQLQVVQQHNDKDLVNLEKIRGDLAAGKTKYEVPAHPITGYADKNSTEAFCEALGLLVAYGPRALLPEVRGWLHIMMPELREVHASYERNAKMSKKIKYRDAVYTKEGISTSTGETVKIARVNRKVRTAAQTGDRLKSSLVQYIDSGNQMSPIDDIKLAPKLRSGIYVVKINASGVYFDRQKMNTDALLRFEDPVHTAILTELDKFWDLKEKYQKKGLLHNRAILMFGPPGSGKSCITKLACEDLTNKGDVVFIADYIPTLTAGLKVFREIEPNRRCLALLEDVDELGEHSLLQLLDGSDTADNIFYLATTNYIDRLSERVKRPGRFDRKVHVPHPPAAGRMAYLKQKLSDENLSQEQFDKLVEATKGFSFGHMRELVTSAFCIGQPLEEVLRRLRGNGLEYHSSNDQ